MPNGGNKSGVSGNGIRFAVAVSAAELESVSALFVDSSYDRPLAKDMQI